MQNSEGNKFRKSVYITLSFLLLLWAVKIVEHTYQIDLGYMGIKPLTLEGTVGIITGPLIHGDLLHLLSNSFPLLILGTTFFYFYDRIAFPVFGLIYLMTGFWVWLTAREGYYHIGASGLVYGLLTFLLLSGFIRRDRATLAISFIMLFLYGGTLFMGLVPGETHISWESHLMGAVAGVLCAVYFRRSPIERVLQPVEEEEPHEEPVYTYYYKPGEPSSPTYYVSFEPGEDEEE